MTPHVIRESCQNLVVKISLFIKYKYQSVTNDFKYYHFHIE